MEIRWDTAGMAKLAANLDGTGTLLMGLRGDVLEASARVDRPVVELRSMVIASLWADSAALDLIKRRRLFDDAESQLLWELIPPPPDDSHRPRLRSRDVQTIEAELQAALDQLTLATAEESDLDRVRAELRIMEHMYELAIAAHHGALLERQIPVGSSALSDLIDFLGYQIAISQPELPPDWHRVVEATSEVRRLLDESWFGDVGRTDLLTIHEILVALEGPELDAVIRGLSDDELYRWFHEFDGVRGGNLSETEEEALFDTVASSASATTLYRLAGAERGSRFMQIATAVQRAAPAQVGMEFIEVCAAHASASDDSLIAALAGLAELDQRRRNVVVASLSQQSLLDPLAAATSSFIGRQTVERDDPVVVEFFQGLGAALGTAARTLVDLTVIGLVDRDRFRETWSQVGGLLSLAFTDPDDFVEIVLDLETLRRNPARWLGSAAAGFATAGIGRLARLGRLGKLPGSAANWLKRVSDRVIIGGSRFRLRAGHVPTALDRVGTALDAAAISESIAELARVDGYLDELAELDDHCPAVAVAP